MRKICVIGHFGFGLNAADGQTIKTATVTRALQNAYGDDAVTTYDTHGSIKTLLKMPFLVHRALQNSEQIVIFPAHRGLRVIVPLLSFFNRRYHRSLHYCVIGGWLPELLANHPFLTARLKEFDGIYVETKTMKHTLESMGFANIFIVSNCKPLTPLAEGEMQTSYEEPYRLCIFSRVMKEKGIEDAVQTVKRVNDGRGRIIFTLDIFGPVDALQKDWFEKLQDTFPVYVRYRGTVPSDQSADTIKDYFALLFPTRFYTEGVPGTIIDAYAAGVPVIAARWESFHDMINDGVTGIGYPFDDADGLYRVLSDVCSDPQRIIRMKASCAAAAADYLPQNALKPLFDNLGV